MFISQIITVISDELKQSFISKKTIITLLVYICFFVLAAHGISEGQKLFQQKMAESGFSEAQVELGKGLLTMGFESTNESAAFLMQAPFFVILLFILSLITLPLLF